MTIKKSMFCTILSAAFMALGGAMAQAATLEKVMLVDDNGNMGVYVSATSVKAGEVVFDVTNAATSTVEHEMLVVLLTPAQLADPKSLPMRKGESRFDEDAVKDFGEVSELQPGATGSLTLTLAPGHYMLVCNVAGHYQAGMDTIIDVK
jgi:uncharacterized cupredoxin-like copper-binding protein